MNQPNQPRNPLHNLLLPRRRKDGASAPRSCSCSSPSWSLSSLLAVLTLSVAVLNQPTGSSFPYTTTYRVSLPDGETVTIGNSKILFLTMGNEVDTSVDGSKERLAIGQERTISARYARISAIGIPVIDTDFQIVLKYIGSSGNNALFDMKIMTSRQVPEILIRQLIPPGMGAQPI